MQSYQTLDEKLATLAVWYIVNASLRAYYKLVHHFGDVRLALAQSSQMWQEIGIHKTHIKRYQDVADTLAFVHHVNQQWHSGVYGIIFLTDAEYPETLKQIYDPPPVVFYRGNIARLQEPQIAIVGSRSPTAYAQKMTFDMAQYLVQSGLTVTSGLAQGVDKMAHLGALAQHQQFVGRTVGVMGTGIDVCYPKNHHALYAHIINDEGCLITELLPATPASKHSFPRRNRLVAGLSVATLVTEAALKSGSLITARFATEMGKQVFAVPSQIDNMNAEGCHHLIREGATLVYHPQQILEDLQGVVQLSCSASFQPIIAQFSGDELPPPMSENNICDIPKHLQSVFNVLSDELVDLDFLVAKTKLQTGELLSQLLELELLGMVRVAGGRYGHI